MYDVIFKNGNVVDVKNEQILQADIAVNRLYRKIYHTWIH